MVSAIVMIVVGVLLFLAAGACAYVLTCVLDSEDRRGAFPFILGLVCLLISLVCFANGIGRVQRFEDAAAGFPTAK